MLGLSRVPPNTILGALLRAPLRLIPKWKVVRVLSGVNTGMRWVVGSSIHGCWLGHYEFEKQAAVCRLVKPGMKVFDIGANAGFYTLAFSRLVGHSGHVWAFEPLPENVANLRRHVALNNLQNVTVVEAAVSNRAGTAKFKSAPSNSMGHLSVDGKVEVRTATIDEIVGIGSGPDLVKMDVEGAEGDVLVGAVQTLARDRPLIALAIHGKEAEKRCMEILGRHGYMFSYLDGSQADPANLTSDEVIATPT